MFSEHREFRAWGLVLYGLVVLCLVRALRAQDIPPIADGQTEVSKDIDDEGRPPSRNPFALDWLDVGYQFDSRHDMRLLSFEGHARPAECVDVYGQLDLYSSLAHDPARFTIRSGIFGRTHENLGGVLWYEDFNGSWNSRARVGLYYDVSSGGPDPFCRLVALPVSSDQGGAMARAMFDVALRPKWSIGGWWEHAWGDEGGDFTATEPELRYEIRKGLIGTLEYRRDEREIEPEGLAMGLRAAL